MRIVNFLKKYFLYRGADLEKISLHGLNTIENLLTALSPISKKRR